jgi:uncharacterized Zn-finger protein
MDLNKLLTQPPTASESFLVPGFIPKRAVEPATQDFKYIPFQSPQLQQQYREIPVPRPMQAMPNYTKLHSKPLKGPADSSNRKFACNICNKRFTRPSTLNSHVNSHNGIKPFACEEKGCGLRFTVKSNLSRHSKICGLTRTQFRETELTEHSKILLDRATTEGWRGM